MSSVWRAGLDTYHSDVSHLSILALLTPPKSAWKAKAVEKLQQQSDAKDTRRCVHVLILNSECERTMWRSGSGLEGPYKKRQEEERTLTTSLSF